MRWKYTFYTNEVKKYFLYEWFVFTSKVDEQQLPMYDHFWNKQKNSEIIVKIHDGFLSTG